MSTYQKSSGLAKLPISRTMVFGGLIFMALIAFELFNYSTTEFSLSDLLGNLKFLGVRWATILAVAFGGIDFAGIARLFTPEKGRDEPAEVWYLFAAWLLAAGMNAILTWWGVSVAIVNHQTAGGAVIAQATLVKVVPVFVALMVWVIRVLIIGTFSVAGENLLWQTDRPNQHQSNRTSPQANTGYVSNYNYKHPAQQTANRAIAARGKPYSPAPKPNPQPNNDYAGGYASRPEPTYHSVAASARSPRPNSSGRN
jgi:hypothetical protein